MLAGGGWQQATIGFPIILLSVRDIERFEQGKVLIFIRYSN
jgi:hypothetical protein